MIHVNMKYINSNDGSFREAEARNNTDFEGFAIISFMFERQNNRNYGVSFQLSKALKNDNNIILSLKSTKKLILT